MSAEERQLPVASILLFTVPGEPEVNDVAVMLYRSPEDGHLSLQGVESLARAVAAARSAWAGDSA